MNTDLSISSTHNSKKNSSVRSLRRVSLTAGWLYILTFVSIPTFALYGPVYVSNYSGGAANDHAAIFGALLEITVALAGIGTAVVLYPLLKRQNETLALGLVAARVLEAATIFVGVAFVLAVVTLQQKGTGTDVPTRQLLVALYDRIFVLGQGFIPAINDLLLGTLLYKSRLVPRSLSLIGIVGAFPLLAGYLATMFGLIDRVSPLNGLSAVPVAVFEFSLGVYLVVKGFQSNAAVLNNDFNPGIQNQ